MIGIRRFAVGNIGAAVGAAPGGGGAPSVTYADLFGANVEMWARPSLGGLAVNSDGSGGTPSIGGSVGLVPDQTGKRNLLAVEALYGSTLDKPIYGETNGKAYFHTNGTSQALQSARSASTAHLYVVLGIEAVQSTNGRIFAHHEESSGAIDYASYGAGYIGFSGSNNYLTHGGWGDRDIINTTEITSGPVVVELYSGNTEIYMSINGGTDTVLSTASDDGARLLNRFFFGVGRVGAYGDYANVKYYDIMVATLSAPPSAGDRSSARAQAAWAAGVTL